MGRQSTKQGGQHRLRRFSCALALGALPLAAAAQNAIKVPSGQPVRFVGEVVDAPGGTEIHHLRFIAPRIGQPSETPDFDALQADMAHLCDSFAASRLADAGPDPVNVVIGLSAAPVEFGQPASDIRQVFEAYTLTGGACRWEPF